MQGIFPGILLRTVASVCLAARLSVSLKTFLWGLLFGSPIELSALCFSGAKCSLKKQRAGIRIRPISLMNFLGVGEFRCQIPRRCQFVQGGSGPLSSCLGLLC
jgi:hypothetical protein